MRTKKEIIDEVVGDVDGGQPNEYLFLEVLIDIRDSIVSAVNELQKLRVGGKY